MSTLIAPKLLSSRHQARELTASLAEDLSGTVVLVDCSALQASTPSFVDELVKAVLVDRGGERLSLRGARADGGAGPAGGAEPGSGRAPGDRLAGLAGQVRRASRSCSSSQPR